MSLEKSVSPSALVSAVRRSHDHSYSFKVKLLIWGRLSPLSCQGAWWHTGRHCAGEVGESDFLIQGSRWGREGGRKGGTLRKLR